MCFLYFVNDSIQILFFYSDIHFTLEWGISEGKTTFGKHLPSIKVWRKWLFIHAGENDVLSASRKTTHTMSLPMCLFLWSFWGSCRSYGSNVLTWNIISMLLQLVYTEYNPEKLQICSFPRPKFHERTKQTKACLDKYILATHARKRGERIFKTMLQNDTLSEFLYL